MPEAPRKLYTGRQGAAGSPKLSQSRTGLLLAITRGTPAGRAWPSIRAKAGSAAAAGRAPESQLCRAPSRRRQAAANSRQAGSGLACQQASGQSAIQPASPAALCWQPLPRGSRQRGSASLTNHWGPPSSASQRCRRRLAGRGPSRSTWAGCRLGSGQSSSRS